MACPVGVAIPMMLGCGLAVALVLPTDVSIHQMATFDPAMKSVAPGRLLQTAPVLGQTVVAEVASGIRVALPAEGRIWRKIGKRGETRVSGWETDRRTLSTGQVLRDRVRIRSGRTHVRRLVRLQVKRRGDTWREAQIQRLRTNRNGRLRLGISLKEGHWRLRLKVPATKTYKRATTPKRRVRVSELPQSPSPSIPAPSPESSPTPAPDQSASICATEFSHRSDSQVQSAGLDEISGLVASRRTPGAWWVHNDSGDDPKLYSFDDAGELLRTVTLAGIVARDWEDLAIGPGPDPELDYLFVGDIGDNGAARAGIVVHRVPEPDVAGADAEVAAFDKLSLTYPDGAHNAEALLVDQMTGALLIVTKSLDGSAAMYSVPSMPAGDQTAVLVDRGDLIPQGVVTGGDVHLAGSAVLLRTYPAVRGWDSVPGEALWETLARPSCASASVGEVQGEAIAFSGSGFGYVTVSEGIQPAMNRFDP